MPTKLTPYLSFRDNAREAMEFYQSVLGGKLTMDTFEAYHASEDLSEANKIMHAQLETPNGLTLMGADTPNGMPYEDGSRISVTLSGEDESELRGFWDKLCQGANVVMPLEKAPWGDFFGMLTDKYGIVWQVNIAGEQAAQA